MVEFYKPEEFPYLLGRGTMSYKKEADETWKPLFSVKEFKTNNSIDELEHEDFGHGMKKVDRVAPLKQKLSFSLVATAITLDALNLWLSGDEVVEVIQSSGSWTAQSFTVKSPGEEQELGKTNLTITSITDDAGTPVPLVEGIDYYIDKLRGLFLPIPSSALVGQVGDIFKITGTYSAHTIQIIQAGKSHSLKRHIWFKGDPQEGPILDIKGYVLFKPSGDLSTISDEWTSLSYEGTFMSHSAYGPYGFEVKRLGNKEL